jgi:capsular exopolysaccharide synthesis family protein
MSRVYRALEKAEREKQETIKERPFAETSKVSEVFPKEETSLEFAGERREPLNFQIGEEASILIPSDNPFAAEEFRKLKTQIFNWSPNPLHVLLVTSAAPDEGKTVVAVNLAVSISEEIEKKAILIDADLRKPSIRVLSQQKPKGLSNYLSDQTQLSEILINAASENLCIIPAGPSAKKSSELIGSRKMEGLLTSLRKFGDDTYIIIDTPPVLSSSEPTQLSKWVDGVILVVMADRTPRESVRRAIQSIDRQKIIGVVLNQKEIQRSSYYSNYYSHYYKR